jgi:Domain of unknown function (DUF4338)
VKNPALREKGITIEEHRFQVQQMLAPHRLELLQQRRPWIKRTERWITDYLLPGKEIDVERIHPYLQLCTSERQHEVWRYFRLWGNIPYNRGCGRLLRYLLRDRGQPGHPIMGIAALTSPVLICNPRDAWIGWQYPHDRELKRQKLLACLDMSVSMAIPPYNQLTAGKMISLAMLSNRVREDYAHKFRHHHTPTGLRENRLVLITTTSIYGSSVQYNRLRMGGRLAYTFAGYTEGYGNAHLTEQEFAEMETYLHAQGKPIPKGWGTGRSYRLRVYTAYYRYRYQMPQAPNHRQPRSVYVAPLGEATRVFLRGETPYFRPYDFRMGDLVRLWKGEWLARRLAKREVMETFRTSNPLDRMLTRQIEEWTEEVTGGQ